MEFALDEQVQGLDVERDDLADRRPTLEAEAPLHQGQVERPGVQAVERLLRARGPDQLDPDPSRRTPAASRRAI